MYRILAAIGLFFVIVQGAVISNEVTETPRIHTSEQLISSIINDCFEINGMSCMKGKVLTYLDTILDLKAEQARAFDVQNIDKVIYDRVSRILASNEIRVDLPKVIFGDASIRYRIDRGIDFDINQKSEGLLYNFLSKYPLKQKRTYIHSPRTIEEEALVPCFIVAETQDESFDANFCRYYWTESNESSYFI